MYGSKTQDPKKKTYSRQGSAALFSINKEGTDLVQVQGSALIFVVLLKDLVQTPEEDLEDIVFGNNLVGQDLELFVAQDVVSVGVVLLQNLHHPVDKVRLS